MHVIKRLIIALCLLGERYLDRGVQRRFVLCFEAGSDVQHVHLAPRHHYPHQGAVISSGTLNTTTTKQLQRPELTIYEITSSTCVLVDKTVNILLFYFFQVFYFFLRSTHITSDNISFAIVRQVKSLIPLSFY